MAARRTKGAGHVGGRRPDGRYPGYLTVNGRRRYVYGTSKTEVRQKLADLRREADEDAEPAERQPLERFLAAWIEVKRRTVRASTWTRYVHLVNNQVTPRIGRIPVAKLHEDDLDALYADLADEGLAPRTIHHVHALLRNALNWLVGRRRLRRNVAQLVEAPTVEGVEIRRLAPDELRRLLAAAEGDRFEALYYVVLELGLRSSEAFGLRRSDVDLATGDVRVRKKRHRVEGVGIVEDDPKTAARIGVRRLGPLATAKLRQHLARQQVERASWTRDEGLVFPNSTGGTMERQNFRIRHWLPLLVRAGIAREDAGGRIVAIDGGRLPTLHGLKHLTGSVLFELGTGVATVQRRLGHARPDVTLGVYTHALGEGDEQDAVAAERLDGWIRALIGADRESDRSSG